MKPSQQLFRLALCAIISCFFLAGADSAHAKVSKKIFYQKVLKKTCGSGVNVGKIQVLGISSMGNGWEKVHVFANVYGRNLRFDTYFNLKIKKVYCSTKRYRSKVLRKR